MTDEQFRNLLEAEAEKIKHDVRGIMEDREPELESLDFGYECYVVELDRMYGYVYMGDLGEWVFAEEDGKLEMTGGLELLEQVKAKTPYGGDDFFTADAVWRGELS